MNAFRSADILLPQKDILENWPVIACDQFTSDPDYWQRVRSATRNVPSSMDLILPEAELGTADEEKQVDEIHRKMDDYLARGILRSCQDAYIYVERTLENGQIRPGLVGVVDLEQYDYSHNSKSLIRATEKTVLERIPPRQRVRRGASLDLSHVLMLCDDQEKMLIEPIQAIRDQLPKLYEMELMESGGHIAGWLVQGEPARDFDRRLETYGKNLEQKYPDLSGAKVLLAVGDGNHSLATAKRCYEELKQANPGMDIKEHPSRFALVELENIHDPALLFESIHRVVKYTNPEQLIADLASICVPGGFPVRWIIGEREGVLELDRSLGELDIAVLQAFLDDWLQNNPGETDYIHDEDAVRTISQKSNTVGFLLQPMAKSQLFRGVIAGGILPRKTFSMGHAREKRYYLEGRKIK